MEEEEEEEEEELFRLQVEQPDRLSLYNRC